MRIVSWTVVIASIGALSWLGLSPLVRNLDFSAVDTEYAVGTTVANTARASIEVAQAELDEIGCVAPGDGAASRDAHQDPAIEPRSSKSRKPACEQ